MTELERVQNTCLRVSEMMCELAAEHRAKGNEDAAKHCAGVAEGLSIAANYARILRPETPDGVFLPERGPRLRRVS